jgi:hypothetical protein
MICSSVKRLGFMSIPQRVMDATHKLATNFLAAIQLAAVIGSGLRVRSLAGRLND